MSKKRIDIKLTAIGELKESGKDKSQDKYILSDELKSAVEVALRLGQPLLLTGEPGTGKTRLAYKVASDLADISDDFLNEPFVFNTKTTSTASDLFYTYDAIKHFQDASIKDIDRNVENAISNYIELQALGKAIALTNEEEVESKGYLKEDTQQPKSSVVLIDEIDKAPRDFPNDILNEIDQYEFEIKEDANRKVTKGNNQNIVVIMTSNSERNLPDAFLRRCVFYHIPFPDKDQLLEIAKQHLDDSQYVNSTLIDYFIELRSRIKEKKPATAELIAWLKILQVKEFLSSKDFSFKTLTGRQKYVLKYSYSVLVKTSEDFSKII